MNVGARVRPVSGEWPCGCTDTDGTVTKVEDIDDEAMVFVGTCCFWQWFPLYEVVETAGARS